MKTPNVKWVNEWYDKREDVPVERCDGGGLETVAVPVLTLTDLEAWMKGSRRTLSQCSSVAHTRWANEVIDDLLAQVQALALKGPR